MGSRVAGAPPGAPVENQIHVCTLWVGPGPGGIRSGSSVPSRGCSVFPACSNGETLSESYHLTKWRTLLEALDTPPVVLVCAW